MWINSPLSKWDQDAIVDKALLDAERRRALQAAAGATVQSFGLLDSIRAGLRLQVERARRAVASIRAWPAGLSAPQG